MTLVDRDIEHLRLDLFPILSSKFNMLYGMLRMPDTQITAKKQATIEKKKKKDYNISLWRCQKDVISCFNVQGLKFFFKYIIFHKMIISIELK